LLSTPGTLAVSQPPVNNLVAQRWLCLYGAAMTFGTQLEAARVAAGLTLTQAAAFVGVREHTWVRWEKDRNQPAGSQLHRIATLLDISADALLEALSS